MYVYRENTAKRQNILTIKQVGQCIQEWTRENLWKAAFTWSILEYFAPNTKLSMSEEQLLSCSILSYQCYYQSKTLKYTQ